MKTTVDFSEFISLLNELTDGLEKPRRLLIKVGEYKLDLVRRGFVEQRSPQGIPWKDLKPATWKSKQTPYIGRETYRLSDSTDYQINLDKQAIELINNTPYAEFFQKERPFLEWTRDDETQALDFLEEYTLELAK